MTSSVDLTEHRDFIDNTRNSIQSETGNTSDFINVTPDGTLEIHRWIDGFFNDLNGLKYESHDDAEFLFSKPIMYDESGMLFPRKYTENRCCWNCGKKVKIPWGNGLCSHCHNERHMLFATPLRWRKYTMVNNKEILSLR